MRGTVRGVALAAAAFSAAAGAADFKLGEDIDGRFHAVATAGTMIRTEAPDPTVYGTLSAARVGTAPGQLGGNSGRNDFNFARGKPVSTVLKGVADLELKRRDSGIFLRAKAWYDFELKDGDRAYGNAPNGFRQYVPLSDNGFDPAAKFANAQLADAYVFTRFGADEAATSLRIGRQVANWGVARFIGGGIDVVNPADFAARMRPGALPEESKIPVGMVYASLAGNKEWGLDGFAQYEFRHNVFVPCGSFFDTTYYAATGCNYVSVLGGGGVNDATALANGLYPKRNADIDAGDGGQFGLSLRYRAAALNTEFRGYAMNYHSRMPSVRGTNPNVAGGYGLAAPTWTRLTDPNGLKYAMIYPENIRLFGLSFDTRLDRTLRFYGEIARRSNQPISLNPSDLIAASLTRSPTSALNLAKNTTAIPPGGTFDGYDRFKVTTTILGLDKAFPNAWGAQRLVLSAELGWHRVDGLPNPGVLRYGRSDDYGIAAINGFACTDTTAAQKSCAHDGFVTTDAWGYRLRLAATYPGALLGATLTPSLMFSHDVDGYSYDGTFLKGRRILRPAIRADWARGYFAEVQYTRISGGAYNTLVDRDTLTLVAGISF